MNMRAADILPPRPDANALFQNGDLSDLQRITIRPLGSFSDFVVEQLPVRMAALLQDGNDAREGLRDLAFEIDERLSSLSEWDVHGLGPEARKVARVDAIYAYNAFIQVAQLRGLGAKEIHEKVVPAKLHFLVKETARQTASPEVLTYEDLVLFNPVEHDPRVFMTGTTGRAERDFYLGHHYIERYYGQAIRLIEEGLNGDAGALERSLRDALQPLKPATDIMRCYLERMQSGEFDLYRVAFGKNPVHGTLGPSGRFTMKVPHLTLLMLGEGVLEQNQKVLQGIMRYPSLFPGVDFARLWHSLPRLGLSQAIPLNIMGSELVDRRVSRFSSVPNIPSSVAAAVRRFGSPAGLTEAFLAVKREMDAFTQLHIAAAMKYTVGPNRPAMGAVDADEMRAVLKQRHGLTAELK